MKIGPIELSNPTVFAPLAGITNLPMRLLAKAAGCALVYSEMVSANGLAHGAAKTRQLLASTPAEKPLNIQIFGSDPAMMAEAARQVEASGAQMVDINCGCAVKKILKCNSGVALMREPRQAEAVIRAVRAAIKIPLTIKIRTGWDPSGNEALEMARIAQDNGVNAIAVHPRTAKQAFTGHADWTLIGRIKTLVRIPVIGNGDIARASDALRMLTETGCDAVMVGRAAVGNPFIFAQIIDVLADRTPREASIPERLVVMEEYINATVAYLGEKAACFMLRSRLGWFAKGLPQASQFRNAIRQVRSKEECLGLLEKFRQAIVEKYES
ncbi:MAG: tRNA dihydrouridine synthase DusB [Desulfobacteraceae bacterium]|nr:tRNA dihydrouridine synthase DusB [Desulfobacteraceae bacterium]